MQEMSRKVQTIHRLRHPPDDARISLDCGAINLAQGFPDFDPAQGA